MFPYFSGLNLEINIEQDEYLSSFTPEAGIKIDISSQGYMPFPLERGLSLPVGFASSIGLRKVNTTVLQPISKKEYNTTSSNIYHLVQLFVVLQRLVGSGKL